MATADSSWAPAAQGAYLTVGGRVRTGAGSRISVTFADGSIVTLEPDSELEVQSFRMTTEGSQVVSREARVALIRGDISGDVREDLLFPPSVFEIVSTGEIVTIRGTLFR